MNGAIAKLPSSQQRALAVLLLACVIAVAASVLVVPLILLHKHYDDAIAALTDRLERYRRVAAQAPEYRKALETMRAKDGRRFFLRNTAPNLAGAELQEQVRSAIEGNGGRITTSQNQSPRDEGRFRQITVTVQFFATTPALQKILFAIEAQPPYLVRREHDDASAQCLPWIQARARAGAGSERPARCRGVRARGTAEEMTAMNNLNARFGAALWWALPLAVLAALLGWETDWGNAVESVPQPAARDRRPSPSWHRCCPTTRLPAASPRAPRPFSARCSTRRGARRHSWRRTAGRGGCSGGSSR